MAYDPTITTRTEADPPRPTTGSGGRAAQLGLGLLFGLIFGFLLQKGGAAKYHILIGVLLFEDFAVIKIMLTAILVGMIGVWWMHFRGIVDLHVKETKLLANVLGGLIFGVGFALAAYCPGTSAAALGQGNYDALAVMAGMVAGSYVFALCSGWVKERIDPVGNLGKVTWAEAVGVSRKLMVPVMALLIAAVLVALGLTTGW